MTDVFAFASRVAMTIFERAKKVMLSMQANSADREFLAPASSVHRMLERRSGHAVVQPTCHCRASTTNFWSNSNLSSYVSLGPNSNACFPLAAHRLRTRSF